MNITLKIIPLDVRTAPDKNNLLYFIEGSNFEYFVEWRNNLNCFKKAMLIISEMKNRYQLTPCSTLSINS